MAAFIHSRSQGLHQEKGKRIFSPGNPMRIVSKCQVAPNRNLIRENVPYI